MTMENVERHLESMFSLVTGRLLRRPFVGVESWIMNAVEWSRLEREPTMDHLRSTAN